MILVIVFVFHGYHYYCHYFVWVFIYIYIYILIIDITVKYHRHHITFIINTFLFGTCYIQLLIVITILKLDCINSFLKIRTLTCFGKASRYLHDFRLSQIDIERQLWGFVGHDFCLAPPNFTNHLVWFPFLENMMFSGTFLKRRRGGCPLCPFTWTLAGRSHGCSVPVDWWRRRRIVGDYIKYIGLKNRPYIW
jgi:hypothetical protein